MAEASLIAGQSSGNLNFLIARKIINKLLTQDRIKTTLDDGRVINLELRNELEIRVAAELTKKLGITLEELEKLKYPYFYEEISSKISLALIRLYCATKFVDDEHESK